MMQQVVVVAGVVGIVSIAVAVAAWRALLRTGNRTLGFVVAAFAVIAAKNLVKASLLAMGLAETPAREMAFSLADLAAVVLVAWPLVGGRR